MRILAAITKYLTERRAKFIYYIVWTYGESNPGFLHAMEALYRLTIGPLVIFCPRQESNLHQWLRTPRFYPLNYEGVNANCRCVIFFAMLSYPYGANNI